MKLSEALKLVQSATPGAEKFSVYLAAGILPLHLSTFLAAHLRRRLPERQIEIQTGIYGDLAGNLSALRQLKIDAAAVVIEWSDLDPRLGLRRLGGWGPDVLSDIATTVGNTANQLLRLLEDCAHSRRIAVCLPTLPVPPISYQTGERFGKTSLVLERILYEFAVDVAQIPFVSIANRQRLDYLSPLSDRLDVKSEISTGFPYTITHASVVGEILGALVQPAPAKKGLITDLDDTLWRGLLGEAGVSGVSWELDQHSHIHALYQQLLRALADTGILVAIASKNDPALVTQAFARQDLVIPMDRVFPVDVSWNPKSQAVGRILKTWNISADAAVFVDDSPMELAEVKSNFPLMECLRFPADDEQAAYALLEYLRGIFGKDDISAEDTIRLSSIKSRAQVPEEISGSPEPFEQFLAQLEAELSLGPVTAPATSRAFELVNKTNQFNLNGRRLDVAQFQTAIKGPETVSLLVSYQDKFGPLGKIAVVLGRLESSVLKIDTWVMSCRAFSRRIEHKCLEYLFESLGLSRIELDFHHTDRNGPLQTFLSQYVDEKLKSGKVVVTREIFMNRKPALFHQINEATYA